MTSTATRRRAAKERAATLAGVTVRRIGLGLPGTVGPLLVAAGFWMVWEPLGVIVLGVILWALDRRVP